MRSVFLTLFPLFLSFSLCQAFFFLSDWLVPTAVWLNTALPLTKEYSAFGVLFVLISFLYLKLIWLMLHHK